jgi:hypothetical protein
VPVLAVVHRGSPLSVSSAAALGRPIVSCSRNPVKGAAVALSGGARCCPVGEALLPANRLGARHKRLTPNPNPLTDNP